MIALLQDVATAWRIFRLLRTLPYGADITVAARHADADSARRSEPSAAQNRPAVGTDTPGPSTPAQEAL